MEIIEEDGEVIVETSGGHKVDHQVPSGDTLDTGVLLHPHTVLTEPQLHLQAELGVAQSLLDLGAVQDDVDSVVDNVFQQNLFISVQYLECFGDRYSIDNTGREYQIGFFTPWQADLHFRGNLRGGLEV